MSDWFDENDGCDERKTCVDEHGGAEIIGKWFIVRRVHTAPLSHLVENERLCHCGYCMRVETVPAEVASTEVAKRQALSDVVSTLAADTVPREFEIDQGGLSVQHLLDGYACIMIELVTAQVEVLQMNAHGNRLAYHTAN